jgi:hypothetical protein
MRSLAASASMSRTTLASLIYLALLAAAPALSLVVGEGPYLADPLSELPVKIWGFERHAEGVFLGGLITSIGHPEPGPLNNPDLLGTLIYQATRPLVGRAGAFDLLVFLQLWAAMVATWALVRDLTRDAVAGLSAAVIFGLCPLVLVYCVSGAVTDMLNLWPWPLALLLLLRAARRGRWPLGLLGGAVLGLGFVTCPYNAVIFAALAVPLLVALRWLWPLRFTPVPDPAATATLRDWPKVGVAALLGVLGTAGLYLLWLRGVMADPDSMMSAEQVASSRHAAPWPYLRPEYGDRYVAYLMDYLAVGKSQLVVREAGSRYFRAFSIGFIAPSLALLGLWASRGRRAFVVTWLGVAFFFALASTGPFLPLTADLALPAPVNPVWQGLFHLLPGSSMLLEPFRYALGVALGLALAASVGTLALQRRFGRWVGWALPLALVLELALISPVPAPLPSAQLESDPAYAELDQHLPPGAIVELPYFERGTHRFARQHFFDQLTHDRPIPDQVVGFLPGYLLDNPLTAELIELERCSEHLLVRSHVRELIQVDRRRLVDDGFVAIVVDHNAYENERRRDAVMALLGHVSDPIRLHGRAVFPLTPGGGATADQP